VIGVILIEPTLDGSCGNCQSSVAGCILDGFQIHAAGRARTDQRVDLGDNLLFEGFFKAPFLAVAFAAAWSCFNCDLASSSLASANWSHNRQKRCPSCS
jgi:hypothetical protein